VGLKEIAADLEKRELLSTAMTKTEEKKEGQSK